MATNIYVGNLSYNVTQDQLGDLFAQYGNVLTAKVVMDQFTNRSKGFGFVEMENNAEGDAAINALNGYNMDNRELRVNLAKGREPRQNNYGNGGGYRY